MELQRCLPAAQSPERESTDSQQYGVQRPHGFRERLDMRREVRRVTQRDRIAKACYHTQCEIDGQAKSGPRVYGDPDERNHEYGHG
jgi:hypothetical protein